MRILNLADSKRGSIDYSIASFSDGQKLINLLGVYAKGNTNVEKEAQIISRMDWNDLQLIVCAAKALKEAGVEHIHLYVPYFLGARSDRKFQEGSVNYLKDVICPIINRLKFDSVTVLDPHSHVLEGCLERYRAKDNMELVQFALNDMDLKKLTLCFPDEGAQKRYENVVKATELPYFFCSKRRNLMTGEIIETKVGTPNDYNDDILIIDDICDGGRTFIEVAKQLRKVCSGRFYLVVTHGIFSAGLAVLFELFHGVYCTNSFTRSGNDRNFNQLEVM